MTMHPSIHARTSPNRAAYIMVESGETVTYAQLDQRSNKAAQMFRKRGLQRGDRIAIFMENHPRFLEICWAAQRSGLYYTPLSSRLTAVEIDYVLRDLGAKLFIASVHTANVAVEVAKLGFSESNILIAGGGASNFASYESQRDEMPDSPIADESCGIDLLYSSGTTGHPKGVRLPLPDGPIDFLAPRWQLYHSWLGFDEKSMHYVPSPLYHALPLHHAMVAQNYGGTVLIVQKFDPKQALQIIERYEVSHSSWVPTMFVRLLKLPLAPPTTYRRCVSPCMARGHALYQSRNR